MTASFSLGRFSLPADEPLVMGILNLTPDSFSGDGLLGKPSVALARAVQMQAEGAHIIDIGAESSRPGAPTLGEQEELDRLVPVLEAVLPLGLPVSVDTRKAAVMRAVTRYDIAMINDINGFRDEAAITAVAQANVALCIMHMQGEPGTMQENPQYNNVLDDVRVFLLCRAQALLAAGVAKQRLIIDPGFGFGKRLEDNISLFNNIPSFVEYYPVLVGVSRKSMLGQICNRPVSDRQSASISAALLAAQAGARIIRVHDVAQTVDALRVLKVLGAAGPLPAQSMEK